MILSVTIEGPAHTARSCSRHGIERDAVTSVATSKWSGNSASRDLAHLHSRPFFFSFSFLCTWLATQEKKTSSLWALSIHRIVVGSTS